MLNSYEAEQSVIGACLLDPSKIERIAANLEPKDFFYIENGIIWQAVLKTFNNNIVPDVVTIADYLEERGAIEHVGGLQYVAEIVKNTPSAHNADSYAQIVADMAQRRRVSDVLAQVGAMVGDTKTPLLEAIQAAQGGIVNIAQNNSERSRPIGDHLTDLLDKIQRRWDGEEEPFGLSFGIADLDKKTYGLKPSDLILIAGRPGMGKTAFLLNMLAACSVRDGEPGVFFSFEMPADQIVNRMAANVAMIPTDSLKDPKEHMTDDYFARLGAAITRIKDAPLVIDDRPAMNLSQMRCAALRWKEHYGRLSWLAVDYLQLVHAENKRYGNREQEVASISRGLKEMAKEFECPVIALSQLNRQLEQRPDKRPHMADLRESGALEQDADIIAFLYRDEIYNDMSAAKGCLEVILGKQREGEQGTVICTAIMEQGRFTDMPHDDQKRIRGLTQNRMSATAMD